MIKRQETFSQLVARVKVEAWPDCGTEQLIRIEPLGSRGDALVFNRKTGRVLTGTSPVHLNKTAPNACFEGSLDEFAEKVERSYGAGNTEEHRERLRDYRAAVAFLRALAD